MWGSGSGLRGPGSRVGRGSGVGVGWGVGGGVARDIHIMHRSQRGFRVRVGVVWQVRVLGQSGWGLQWSEVETRGRGTGVGCGGVEG